jgi:hypothetical protein
MKISNFSEPTYTVVEYVLDSADIATLSSTGGLELLANQGLDKAVLINSFAVLLDAGTTPFAGAGNVVLRRDTTAVATDTVANVIGSASDSAYVYDVSTEVGVITPIINKNINLRSSVAITGGADAKLRLRLSYSVLSITTPTLSV